MVGVREHARRYRDTPVELSFGGGRRSRPAQKPRRNYWAVDSTHKWSCTAAVADPYQAGVKLNKLIHTAHTGGIHPAA